MKIDNIKKVVIAGAGTMGSSIAQVFAGKGYDVVLYDIKQEILDKSCDLIKLNQATSVKENSLTQAESDELLRHISYSCDKEVFRPAHLVVETIVERMDIKHSFFAEISELVSADTLLTSNTSGLSLTEIAKAVKGPERFCGFHWVNPPHIVPLVEVIRGGRTSDETAQAVYSLAERIGKVPTMVKDGPGFCLNRLQFAVLREAMHIVESGIASKEDVDKTFKYGLGMRYACLGPFEIADLGGLDTFYRISEYLFAQLSDRKDVPDMLKECFDSEAYGVKSGKGFYDYSNGRDKQVIAKRDADFIKIAKCLYEDK